LASLNKVKEVDEGGSSSERPKKLVRFQEVEKILPRNLIEEVEEISDTSFDQSVI